MPDNYKTSKEAFVSHQSGSTVAHVNLLSIVALSSVALHSALHSRLPQNRGCNLVTEFVLLGLPLLLSMTVFAENLLILNAILLCPTLLLFLLPAQSRQSLPSSRTPSRPPSPIKPRSNSLDSYDVTSPNIAVTPLPALTTHRAHMLLMTFLCILAVDFPVFPRKLAKCETFGVSLMDMGVGSFVFSQGVVSAIPLLKNPSHLNAPVLHKLRVVSQKMLPLIILGLVRVLLVKGTEYPEHESEYGVHWNFFLTMATLPPLQVLLHHTLLSSSIFYVGLGITLLHQFLLSNTFLQSWTLNAPRTNIIAQNKEGLVSLPGYLAIHVFGLLIGTMLLPPSPSDFRRILHRIRHEAPRNGPSSENNNKPRYRQDIKTAIELCSYAVVWWCLLWLGSFVGLGGGVSRRLANARYVFWVAAYNTSFLTAYLVLDAIFFPVSREGKRASHTASNRPSPTSSAPYVTTLDAESQPPRRRAAMLLEAINANGLALFLLANVATGLVNLLTQTLYTSDTHAMVILLLYAFGISTAAWVLKDRRVLKL